MIDAFVKAVTSGASTGNLVVILIMIIILVGGALYGERKGRAVEVGLYKSIGETIKTHKTDLDALDITLKAYCDQQILHARELNERDTASLQSEMHIGFKTLTTLVQNLASQLEDWKRQSK